MLIKDFASAIASFKYTEEDRIAKETLRKQFLDRFPASHLRAMTIEQYSLGLEPTENSFCYWLEYKTRSLGGIGGINASKFVIFYNRKLNKYVFNDRYDTKEQAFEAVKSGLQELLRLAEKGEFEKCDTVQPFDTVTLVRGKVLNMYFPETFLPIFSLDHSKDFCLQFGVQADFESHIAMNLALLNFKQQTASVSDWSNDKFASFIYDKFPPTIQFWKIAPGKNARLWPHCVHGGFICIGWDELGDMRQQKDEATFKEQYRDQYGAQSVRQWKEVWSFAKEMREGDIVVANNGLRSIVGIGTVTGDYWYNENRAEYKHCVPVQWNIKTEFAVPASARSIVADWFRGTVKKITREEYNQLLIDGVNGEQKVDYVPTEPLLPIQPGSRYDEICRTTFLPAQFFADCERLLRTKGQIVLQGAPGTGKTFVAERLAALWAGDKKRVKVVQFHESYGYEDFVHGIKPERDPASKLTAFVPKSGTFLRFCEEIGRDNSTPRPNYVMLIDEINRAKTARVFGELLYLLEYREKEVELQNGTPFSIPPNLYIIATMNTTDKSIALVDYALRRRFAFIDLLPVKNGQSIVLRKWLESNGISNAAEVDRLFIALNTAIAQKDEALMVGHSFFMPQQAVEEKRFSAELLRFIWSYYILPLIAEYEYQTPRAELEEKYGFAALGEDLE